MTGPLAGVERGDGPLVVLLHGQPGTGTSWDPVTDLLAVDHHVVAPDRPGYGSTGEPAVGLSANADTVAGLIVERGGDQAGRRATVVAHSWSGGAAVLLADRYPHLVGSLVLVGAACTPGSLNALDRWLTVPVMGDGLTVLGLAGIGTVLPRLRPLSRFVPARMRDQVATALPDQGVTGSSHGVLGRHRRTFMVEQRALVDELPTVATLLGSLTLPVEVVTGQWDLVVPPAASDALARAVRSAGLTVIPRAGHFVARDAPAALVDVIRRAVSAHRPE